MPEPEDERDAAMLDSEIKESENGIDLDNNADTREDTSESESQNEATNTNDAKESKVESHLVTAENLSSRRGQPARADEPYDWNRCTTVITLQIMPPRAEQDVAARKVFLSARTHAEPPYTANMRWSDLEPRLPEEIKTLLTRLQQDLPQRAAKRAAEQQAEREREKELQAQAEKRAADKKAKGQTKAPAARTRNRNKRVDLNSAPVVTPSQEGIETDSTPASSDNTFATNLPSKTDANPTAPAQISLF